MKSSFVSIFTVCASRSFVARSRSESWISCKSVAMPAVKSAVAGNVFSLCPRSRRATATLPFSKSRRPISTRTGTPFLIHSQLFTPPPRSRLSTCTRTGSPPKVCLRSSAASASHAGRTVSRISGFGVMGTMTICSGATRGGSTAPSSSACAMMTVPTSRVLTPQDVVHAYSCLFSREMNLISLAFAKFCPRKCDVPAWIAFRSCTIASMHSVSTAPGKRSPALFSPVKTGSASQSRAKVSYTRRISIVSSRASFSVSCAVWPSCQRNSAVRRKTRGRISHRTTFAHWLIKIGRSRYDCTHFA